MVGRLVGRVIPALPVVLSLFVSSGLAQQPRSVPVALTSTAAASASRASDWPCWRGPQHDGHAADGQQPPLAWSEDENVVWKTPLPGRGHGSAIVVGDQIVLATADEQQGSQWLLCFDRETGKPRWQAKVHAGGAKVEGNKKASLASSTPAYDGERLFINFLNDGAVYTSAVSRAGKLLWQTKIVDYTVHQGYGSSPAIYDNLVIVSADNKAGGAIAALDRATGEVVWKHARPKTPNYASPVIVRAGGKTQLIFIGCDLVSSYDPTSGKRLWEFPGATTECVTSTVTDGAHIYTTGGYPKNHIAAMKADGSGEVAWENKTRVYVPSMLIKDGRLYAVADAGVAMCIDSATGDEIWKDRLGGAFSSSPVLVGERIYVTDEKGTTSIFKASPEKFELLGKNKLGDDVIATPTFVDGRIYYRAAVQSSGQRQEFLYCLGAE